MIRKEPRLYYRVFVWSGTLRLFHWTLAFSTFILILTGIYIHYPPITTKWAEFKPLYIMATLRYWHFAAGYFFICALAVRFYLFFAGNQYERPTDFLPINKRNLKSLVYNIKFYLYLTDEHECRMGHTILAGTIYFVLFICGVVMGLTGLYLLYPETPTIAKIGHELFGTPQQARLIHYLLNWFFIFFILVHLYIAIWNDFNAPDAIISGAFSGSKMMPADLECPVEELEKIPFEK